jgi:hypothetical protein
MKRHLVIASQTLIDAALVEAIAARVAAGSYHVHILVPAGPLPGRIWPDGEALGLARDRLHAATVTFGRLGASVDGEIGDPSPLVAAGDVLRRDPPYDEVIVSTFGPGVSTWLKMDLPRRIERLFGAAVCHVVCEVYPGTRQGEY